MKRRKAKSVPATSFPEEADPFHAKKALRDGDEGGVGYFARDHAKALSLLADLFDPPEGTARKLQFISHRRKRPTPGDAAGRDEDSDWEGTLLQVKDAIETGSPTPIGWYLRDAADAFNRVGDALDPPSRSQGWQLKFVRRGSGRRADPHKMLRDSAIKQDLAFATRRLGKQEAGIADLQAKGISRARAFRAKKRPSNRKPESQEKR